MAVCIAHNLNKGRSQMTDRLIANRSKSGMVIWSASLEAHNLNGFSGGRSQLLRDGRTGSNPPENPQATPRENLSIRCKKGYGMSILDQNDEVRGHTFLDFLEPRKYR